MTPETKETAIEKIEGLIIGDLLNHKILSLKEMKNNYSGGYIHKHIENYNGFSIWGVFFESHKVVCLYSQDSKARILYYDPDSGMLNKWNE